MNYLIRMTTFPSHQFIVRLYILGFVLKLYLRCVLLIFDMNLSAILAAFNCLLYVHVELLYLDMTVILPSLKRRLMGSYTKIVGYFTGAPSCLLLSLVLPTCQFKEMSSSRFPFVEVRSVVTPLYGYFCFFSIAPCCWPFLSTFLPPRPLLDLSSHI